MSGKSLNCGWVCVVVAGSCEHYWFRVITHRKGQHSINERASVNQYCALVVLYIWFWQAAILVCLSVCIINNWSLFMQVNDWPIESGSAIKTHLNVISIFLYLHRLKHMYYFSLFVSFHVSLKRCSSLWWYIAASGVYFYHIHLNAYLVYCIVWLLLQWLQLFSGSQGLPVLKLNT